MDKYGEIVEPVTATSKSRVYFGRDSVSIYQFTSVGIISQGQQVDLSFDAAVKIAKDILDKLDPDYSKDQTVMVNLTGDKWLVDIAGEVVDQIAEQSKGGRVVIKREEK